MSVNKNKTRISITLPERQAKWLDKLCKEIGISKSKYIFWLLTKTSKEMLEILEYEMNYDEEREKEILQIIKTPWVN